jgi:predicted AAA+ superfamily ATPase
MRTVPKPSLAEVYQRIATGSMPRLWTEPNMDHETYYRSYVATYLQRDIRDLSQVADETVFLTFMTAVAARTACPLIMDELARDVGVSIPTVKRWLSILSSSGIITLVPPYHNNILSRMTKMPLLHMLDTGLAAYLLRWTSPEVLERGAMAGQFFESYVFAELYKSFAFAGQDPPLYYYRDKDKREIDVLIHREGVLHPLEIKKSAAPGPSALKNFRALNPLTTSSPGRDSLKTTIGSGGVLCMTDDVIPIDATNSLIPAWLI